MTMTQILAGLLLAAPLAVVAYASPTTPPGPLACHIEAEAVRGGTLLTAQAVAETAGQGSYRFSVRSRSSGGTSDITQGGDFAARAGQTVDLSQSQVGGSYTARLVLTTAEGEIACEKTG